MEKFDTVKAKYLHSTFQKERQILFDISFDIYVPDIYQIILNISNLFIAKKNTIKMKDYINNATSNESDSIYRYNHNHNHNYNHNQQKNPINNDINLFTDSTEYKDDSHNNKGDKNKNNLIDNIDHNNKNTSNKKRSKDELNLDDVDIQGQDEVQQQNTLKKMKKSHKSSNHSHSTHHHTDKDSKKGKVKSANASKTTSTEYSNGINNGNNITNDEFKFNYLTEAVTSVFGNMSDSYLKFVFYCYLYHYDVLYSCTYEIVYVSAVLLFMLVHSWMDAKEEFRSKGLPKVSPMGFTFIVTVSIWGIEV